MKQKAVIKFSLNCCRSSSKALKTAVSVSGVESAKLKGEDKSEIEVIGDGMDAAVLTIKIRKKVGYAQLVSVGPVSDGGEKKQEPKPNKPEEKVQPKPNKPEEKVQPSQHFLPCQDKGVAVPHYDYHVFAVDRQPECCSIM